MPSKKGGKKKSTQYGAAFNQTKKQFPTLNKLNQHKKSYVSPYSVKTIQKP